MLSSWKRGFRRKNVLVMIIMVAIPAAYSFHLPLHRRAALPCSKRATVFRQGWNMLEVGRGSIEENALQISDSSYAHQVDLKQQVSRKKLICSSPTALVAVGLFFSFGNAAKAACEDQTKGKRETIREDYDSFSSKYDELDGGPAAGALGLDSARAQMLGSARGLVLEVAVGTGLNLPMYRFRSEEGQDDDVGGQVDKLIAVDLSPGMLSQATSKASKLQLDESLIDFKLMDVEKLEFPDATFDTVVDTFGLCVFADPVAALREMRRVCKPGGRILLLENSISNISLLAAYQTATAPLVAKFGGKGCLYDRDPAALAAAAGLVVLVNEPLVAGGVFRRIEANP